jgi:hypothetical protein
MRKSSWTVLIVSLLATACGGGGSTASSSSSSSPSTSIATAVLPASVPKASADAITLAVNDLVTTKSGSRYRVAGAIPKVLDVSFAAPDGDFTAVFSGSVFVGQPDKPATNAAAFYNVSDIVAVTSDPFIHPKDLATADDFAKVQAPAPADLFDWIANHPWIELRVPQSTAVIAGRPARVMEITTKPLPPEAKLFAGNPGMVLFFGGSGWLSGIPGGDVQRVAMIDTGVGELMVWANPTKLDVDRLFASIELTPLVAAIDGALPLVNGVLKAGVRYNVAEPPMSFVAPDTAALLGEQNELGAVVVRQPTGLSIFSVTVSLDGAPRLFKDVAQSDSVLNSAELSREASIPSSADLAADLAKVAGLEVVASGPLKTAGGLSGTYVDVRVNSTGSLYECADGGQRCGAVFSLDGWPVGAPTGFTTRLVVVRIGGSPAVIKAALGTPGEAVLNSLNIVGI